MKPKLIKTKFHLSAILLFSLIGCSQSAINSSESKNSPTESLANSPEVEFILGYVNQEWSGSIKDTIEKINGNMIIDFEQSVLNSYWIARGEKSGVLMKISEPDYKIEDAWLP